MPISAISQIDGKSDWANEFAVLTHRTGGFLPFDASLRSKQSVPSLRDAMRTHTEELISPRSDAAPNRSVSPVFMQEV
jgi:hypothetical protein